MLRANKRKKQVYMETSLPRVEINHLVVLSFALLMIICLYPEVSLAKGVESQLTKVNTLTDKVKEVGLTLAVLCAGGYGVIKGKLAIVGIAGAVIISIAILIEWIKGGMVLLG